MSSERRRAPRVTERVALAITEAGVSLQTETKNLSTSGAYCTLDRFLPPMTKLQLVLELPNPSGPVHVRCTGIVVRVEPVVAHADRTRYHVAVFFTDLAQRDREAIAAFVRQRLSASSSAR